jgi:hypothetical protein
MEIKLKNKKTITVSPARTKEIESLTVVRIINLPVEKKVRVFIRELGQSLELPQLSGENYGTWTDKAVESAIIEELAKL